MAASRRPALYRDELDRLVVEPYVFREGRIVLEGETATAAESFWESEIKPLSSYASLAVLAAVLLMVAVIFTKSTAILILTQIAVLAALGLIAVRGSRIKRWIAGQGLSVD